MFSTNAAKIARPTPGAIPYYTQAEMRARFLESGINATNSKRGLTAIGAGVDYVMIAFTTVFGAVPRNIVAVVRMPDASGQTIPCVIDESTVTAAGFTARFPGPTPDANHQLDWWAIL